MTALNANLTVLAGKLHYVTFGVIARNITRLSKTRISHWFIRVFYEPGFLLIRGLWFLGTHWRHRWQLRNLANQTPASSVQWSWPAPPCRTKLIKGSATFQKQHLCLLHDQCSGLLNINRIVGYWWSTRTVDTAICSKPLELASSKPKFEPYQLHGGSSNSHFLILLFGLRWSVEFT
jgi:hypothetical protein